MIDQEYLEEVVLHSPHPHPKSPGTGSSHVRYFFEPIRAPVDFRLSESPIEFESIKKEVLVRKRFIEASGLSYWAWTYDGVTPVFPVPKTPRQ